MNRDAGFTLIEVLAALVVLGFVVAGIGQGLRFGLDATARQERQAAARGDLEAVDRVLRRIVGHMEPGTEREPNPVLGEPAALAFTTDLGAAASALATTRAEVRLAVEAGTLVLRWRPSRHAVPFGPPPPPDQAVLLEGLDRIELSYWGPQGDAPPAWHAEWRQRAVPALVRIRLSFPAGSPRRWPDIVIAPATPSPAG